MSKYGFPDLVSRGAGSHDRVMRTRSMVSLAAALAVTLGCGGGDEGGSEADDAGGSRMDATRDAVAPPPAGDADPAGSDAEPPSEDADTPVPDGALPPADGGRPPPPDSGPPPPGGTGTPCMRNGDCPDGVCLPIRPGGPMDPGLNVCTTRCASGADCVAGWTCGPIGGVDGDVCQCTVSSGGSQELCNGRDDDCDGRVDEAGGDDLCEPGHRCVAGRCTCEEMCGGTTCVDLLSDEQSCGACGARCPTGGTCFDGSCVCSVARGGGGTERTLCGDACVDTRRDDRNCGGCGVVCAAGDGEQQHCEGGTCVCNSRGFTLCSGSCVDARTDPANCGTCGTVCPAGCTDGVCDCLPPLVRCGDSCVDNSADEAHCGGCGRACPDGWTCCGGACRDTPHDVTSCGVCGRDCRKSPSSGLIYCDSGTCGSCDPTDPGCVCPVGLTGCNETCVDTSYDVRNCGRCGNVCPRVGCGFSTCAFGCSGGSCWIGPPG